MAGRPPWKNRVSGGSGKTAAAQMPIDPVIDLENKTALANSVLDIKEAHNIPSGMLPPRPGYSTRGTKVSLLANCFQLQLAGDVKFFFYSVAVKRIVSEVDDIISKSASLSIAGSSNTPPAKSGDSAENDPNTTKGRKLGYIIQHLLSVTPRFAHAVNAGTMGSDFRNTIISTKKLAEDSLVCNITYRGEKSRYHNDNYRIVFTFAKEYSLPQLLNYLTSTDHVQAHVETQTSNKNAVIQALNIILRHQAKNNSFKVRIEDPPTQSVVGSKTFNLGPDLFREDLGVGAEVLRGYFSSIRPATGRLLVNVNVSHGPFFKSGPLQDLVAELRRGSLRGVRVVLKHREETDSEGGGVRVIKAITGLASRDDGVVTRNSKGKAPDYPPRIVGDVSQGATCQQVKFWSKETKAYVSVHDYLQKHEYLPTADFQNTLTIWYPEIAWDGNELAVNVGTQLRPEYVPISVCEVVEGQNYRHTLDADQTTKTIRHARMNPWECVQSITTQGPTITGLKTQTLNGNRLTTNFNLVKVQATKLPAPEVNFKSQMRPVETVAKASWNLNKESLKYSKSGLLCKWGILVVKGGGAWQVWQQQEVDKIIDMMRNKIKTRGLGDASNLTYRPKPTLMTLADFRTGVALTNKLNQLKNDRVGLAFVWLPDQLTSVEYGRLKFLADVEVGIHTVCFNSRKGKVDDRPERAEQYWDNVFLKVNLKLGGVNQTISFPDKRIISFKTTMVLGLDVTHPAPAPRSNEETPVFSTVGMVASTDEDLGQWPATITTQVRDRQEVVFSIDTIRALLKPHLARWKANHTKYPAQILVYRDGVSEGQYNQVVKAEYEHIKEVCGELEGCTDIPRITIVIAAKRHHMRFYQEATMNHALYRGNPEPGTVVDRGVTSQFLWEFYLQAHYAIMGTARPAHYVVVVDEIFAQIQIQDRGKYKNRSEILHDVTLSLSYTLGRSTTATSICTPAYLADKACDRARFYRGQTAVHSSLRDSMFYI